MIKTIALLYVQRIAAVKKISEPAEGFPILVSVEQAHRQSSFSDVFALEPRSSICCNKSNSNNNANFHFCHSR